MICPVCGPVPDGSGHACSSVAGSLRIPVRIPPPAREAPVLVATHLALNRLRLNGHRVCVVFRRSVGLFVTTYGSPLRIGEPGQADLYGYLCSGRGLEVECKSLTGRLSKQQERWRDVCREMNVLWILARSPEQACAEVMEAMR